MGLFRDPAYLGWMLLAAALAAGLAVWSERRTRRLRETFARPEILLRLFAAESIKARRLKYALGAGALVMLLAALAGPQWGVELVTSQGKGTQVVIAVDTSESMLAEDLKPNRMRRAQDALAILIDELSGSRVGLIAFAGEAFVQCPLTTDREAAKSLLRRLRTGMIPQAGTALGKAIELGTRMLGRYPGHKALVLLTDGEDHGSHPLVAARTAAEGGIHLFIIGMGTPEGEPIPVKDSSGRVVAYKKDKDGKTVVTRLGESGLIQLAAASKGAYYRAGPGDTEASAIVRAIGELEKSDIQAGSVNRYKNRYRFPLLAAFLLLLAELLLPELRHARPARRGGSPARLSPANEGPRGGPKTSALAALLLLAIPTSSRAMPSDLRLWKGNKQYSGEDYGEALKQYEKADPSDPKSRFNAGAALYKLGDFGGAVELYEELARELDPGRSKGSGASRPKKGVRIAPKAYYNLGNSLYREEKFQEAAEAYKRCLMLDPSDEDCRHNLVLTLKPPKKKKQKKDSKKDQKNQKKEDPSSQPPSKDRPRPQGLSKEDAERILRAVKEKEREALRRQPVQRKSARPDERKPEVDW
ncbi:MAG: VWA domain-containing protein [Elusimicrobiota bacterium]